MEKTPQKTKYHARLHMVVKKVYCTKNPGASRVTGIWKFAHASVLEALKLEKYGDIVHLYLFTSH